MAASPYAGDAAALAVLARRCRQVQLPGPSPAQHSRMRSRFWSSVERGDARFGLLRGFGYRLNTRLAAGVLAVSLFGGGASYATGYTPASAFEDTATVVRTLARNLTPHRPGGPPFLQVSPEVALEAAQPGEPPEDAEGARRSNPSEPADRRRLPSRRPPRAPLRPQPEPLNRRPLRHPALPPPRIRSRRCPPAGRPRRQRRARLSPRDLADSLQCLEHPHPAPRRQRQRQRQRQRPPLRRLPRLLLQRATTRTSTRTRTRTRTKKTTRKKRARRKTTASTATKRRCRPLP